MTIKSMFAVGVTALCASVFAEPLESANVVGYQTFSATKNTYQLKSVQFDGVGKNFNIKDFGGTLTGPSYDEDGNFASTAPMLMVREGNGYVNYFYLSDGAFDEATESYVPGWADVNGNPLPSEGVEIEAGTAFWFVDQYNETSSIITPGQVNTDATSEMTFNVGYTLAACPYPKAVSFAEITFEGLTGPGYDEDGNFASTAPMMMVREGNGYVTYFYLSDGSFDAETETYVPGWADVNGNPLEDNTAKIIGVGSAFWVVLPENSASIKAIFSL